MENLIAVLLLTFSLQRGPRVCTTGMSIGEPGEGDPAPGRSPGPPDLESCGGYAGGPVRTLAAEDDVAGHLNVNVSHELYDAALLVPGIVYQVAITRKTPGVPVRIEFTIASRLEDGTPGGTFVKGEGGHHCQPHEYRDRLNEADAVVRLNWTFKTDENTLKSNVSFTLTYKLGDSNDVFEQSFSVPVIYECQLWLKPNEKLISWTDLPPGDCQVWFPGQSTGHGLVVDMLKLNIPCSKGFLHFSGLNNTAAPHQHFRGHKQTHLCGKLEELPDADRHIYFPSSHTFPFLHVHGAPVFALNYHLVDYCYNLTFAARNGSFDLKPTGELECTFKIYLPYGNRVALTLLIGDDSFTGKPETDMAVMKGTTGSCEGLYVRLIDGDGLWSHCNKPGDVTRRIEMVSRENKVVLKVSVHGVGKAAALGMRMRYRAEPLQEIVGLCGFGWVAIRQFCVSAVENSRMPWVQAEGECARRGGHLASIRNDHAQTVIDNLLLNR